MGRKIGFLLLIGATLIFAAANSIIAKLGLLGAHHLIDGRNPISFCNVLFTANLMAGLTLLGIHWKSWNRETLKRVRVREWGLMLILALLSGVIAPTLFFLGLMLTQVINVVLISTLDIPLVLIFGWLMFKERPSWGSVVGALLALGGVALTFILHQPPAMPMEMKMTMINLGTGPVAHFLATLPRAGEICVGIGVLFTMFSIELTRKWLDDVPSGIYSVFRMVVGATIFFIVVLIMLGWVHFIDIFSPFLWEWMLLYGGVVIGLGLYLWYRGIQHAESADLAISNSITPIAGAFFAYLILSEVPEHGQLIGGAFIVFGIIVALVVNLRQERKRRRHPCPNSFSGL